MHTRAFVAGEAPSRSRSCFFAALGVCAGVVACEGEKPHPDIMGRSPYCTRTEEDVAIDKATPLRLSVQEVLDQYAAPMVGQLDWMPAGEGYELLLNTGSERTDVTVAVAYDGGRIWFLDQEVVIPEGPLQHVEIICPDQLRVDVNLDLTTADGALEESWDTTLIVGADPCRSNHRRNR